MNATVMAIILVLIVVATVVTKKVPFNFVLFIVPIICSLLLGFSLQETSDFVLEQFSSIMKCIFRCLQKQEYLILSYQQ